MRLASKVLLITLATTLGLCGLVLWLVTRSVTAHEERRARIQIRRTIASYHQRLAAHHALTTRLVQQIMEEPVMRAQLDRLESEDDPAARAALRAQFREQIFGVTIARSVSIDGIEPTMHVLMNESGDVLVSSTDLASPASEWTPRLIRGPLAAVLSGALNQALPVWTGQDFFLAFGVPLRLQLGGDAPAATHACFVGFRVDDAWLRHFLGSAPAVAEDPLRACYLLDGAVVAQAASNDSAGRFDAAAIAACTAAAERLPAGEPGGVAFASDGERFVGEVTTFEPASGPHVLFAVASSLDAALADLRGLQRRVALATAVVMVLAVIVCRGLAALLARPVERLVVATQRISRGEFSTKLDASRRDEFGALARSVNEMAAGLEQRDLIKDTFGKFVDPKIVEGFLADPARLRLGGERRVQSILFSDLANFTTLAEQLTPEELIGLLNGYLGEAADVVAELHGIVDKFIGDAVVAFWGLPLMERHAEAACRAALRVTRLGAALARTAQALGCPSIHVRVGVGTGEVLVGNIGSPNKYNYTVIGDVVNLASRLEGINKLYGTRILITQRTADEAGPCFAVRRIDTVCVVGRHEPVELIELIAESADDDGDLRARCDSYAAALQLYERRDWPAARAAFESHSQRWPDDRPSQVMAGRCLAFLEQAPSRAWDGVWTLDAK